MAGAGYKLFATGDVLTAAQVNTYLNEQTVMVFANAAARTSALTSVLAEGMVSYLQDTNAVEVYNGTAWVGVSGTGDITEVQAGVGISITSGTGPIPVITNSSTDLITTAGDILYGTAADTVARLGIGTAGQVLKVNSGATAPEWGAPAAGGKVLQVIHASTTTSTTIASTTYTDTTLTATITPSSATSKILILVSQMVFTEASSYMAAGCGFRLMRNSTAVYSGTKNDSGLESGQNVSGKLFNILPLNYLDSPNTTSAVTYKTQGAVYSTADSRTSIWQISNSPSNIVLLEIGA